MTEYCVNNNDFSQMSYLIAALLLLGFIQCGMLYKTKQNPNLPQEESETTEQKNTLL